MKDSGRCQRDDCFGLISQVFSQSQADLGDQPERNPLAEKISKHSTPLDERVPLEEGEVYEGEWEEDLEVDELQLELQEEHGIGAHLRTDSVVCQAREFLKELNSQSRQDHRLVVLHFLVWEQDSLPTWTTERETLKIYISWDLGLNLSPFPW